MRAVALLTAGLISMTAQAQEPVRLYAAGSLRNALNEVISSFKHAKVEAVFGASGLLRERIAKGEPAEVFASANMEHPRALEMDGKAGPVKLFARNRLCALAGPGVRVETGSLLERMLDPAVKVGTSTPKADPSGDYAWELFEKAEQIRPGSYEILSRKALKLAGAPGSPQAPAGRSLYAMLIGEGKADLFLTYCTNALAAQKENAALRTIQVPSPLAVGADYGLTVMKGARPQAERFAQFILLRAGQDILGRHGFGAGDPP